MASFSLPNQEYLKKYTPLLAIETSCDDTACAILDHHGHVLAEQVLSQTKHEELGGVVPEIAARAHLDALPTLVKKTLHQAGLMLSDIKSFAATTGPGLIGGLIVGSSYAKGLALAQNKKFIAINHIEAHILTPRLPEISKEHGAPLPFPYLALLISGGHCQYVHVEKTGHYRRLGGTIDDSAGEAFDKVAKMLGLGWPGGPALEKIAQEGDPFAYSFPRPLKGREGCDFSFSGLKTAVSRLLTPYGNEAIPRNIAANIAASFQEAVADVIEDRLSHALMTGSEYTCLVVAGGVAANKVIRTRLMDICKKKHLPFLAPPLRLCTDNAVMIGWAALERLLAGEEMHDIALAPRPRWPLEERAL